MRFVVFATLGGLVILSVGQYWVAGKWLAEIGVILVLFLSQGLTRESRLSDAYRFLVICYLGTNITFGFDRIWEAAQGIGVAHASPAYPSSYTAGWKASVDWDIGTVVEKSSRCRHIELDIDHPFLDHYAQLALSVQNLPWSSTRPINDYYGMLPDRELLPQVQSDCLISARALSNGGKIGLGLSSVKNFGTGDEEVNLVTDREIGIAQPSGVKASGLYSAELFRGQLLRWTTAQAEFHVSRWGDGKPGRVTLKLWGIAPGGLTSFTLTANGTLIDQGVVTTEEIDKTVDIPPVEIGQDLDLRLISGGVSPPGDSRTLGVALRSLVLTKDN